MKYVISVLLLLGPGGGLTISLEHTQSLERNNTSEIPEMSQRLVQLTMPLLGQLPMNNVTLKDSNFGFNLYRQVSDKHDDNVFLSPLCALFALASLMLGTKGVTHDEILQSLDLHLPHDSKRPDLVPALFRHVKDVITEDDELILDQGNFAFIHEEFPIKEVFLNMSKKYFDMEVQLVDFHNSTVAKDIINQHVKKLTRGKIPQLYDSLDPQTKCILLSYMLFKGKWLYPFNEAFTELQPFHINKYKIVKVPMMYKVDKISSMVDKKFGCTVVKLPYRGRATMLVILPEEGRDYAFIEDHLTSELVAQWLGNMTTRKIDVLFPKFKLDHKYEMSEVLQELGIRDVFSGSGNLTGLTDQRNMRVSKITQRAVIEVDEKGTEAAAATGSEIVPYSMPPTIRVDRPFLFMIYEESFNSLLFIGRVINPLEQ